MTQDTSTYYVWIGGSCDYGHKERAGGAAVVIKHNGNIISRDLGAFFRSLRSRSLKSLRISVFKISPGTQDNPQHPSIIQNKVKSSSPCKQNPSIKSLF